MHSAGESESFSLVKDNSCIKERDTNEREFLREVSETAKRLSPITLPMISYLDELGLEG